MRRTILAATLSLIGVTALGCVEQRALHDGADHPYRSMDLFTPLAVPAPSSLPVSGADATPEPSTVLNPDQEIRYITLAEAVAIALEQGNVGTLAGSSPGSSSDNLLTFQGRTVGGSDSMRVLALNPAITGTDVEASLAKFDAHLVSSVSWINTDEPIATAAQALEAGDANLEAIRQQYATMSTSLIKPLATGGVAGITFRTDYTNSNLPSPVNPVYQPQVQFQFEQPLLRGFGVDINQLRSTHPGSLLTPFDTGGRVEGILITRARLDQQRTEFERNVQVMLWNVEAAYWNLYGEYWNLYSREEALRQAYETWRVLNAQAEAGRVQKVEVAQARGQYERFRNLRLQALGSVLEAERRLRGLLGLTRTNAETGVPDNRRLVPADEPSLAAYHPDWSAALQEALTSKPELLLAQQEVRVRHYELTGQKDQLLPDLRFTATYNVNDIGSRLDGPGTDDALRNLLQDRHNDWTMGLRLDVPLGFRDAHAGTRAAKLSLAQAYLTLKDQEEKVARFLELQYRQLFESAERIRISRAQRQAYAEELELRLKEFQAGRNVPLYQLLESQRFWADALTDEMRAVVEYNTALAGFEFAKGTILRYNNVMIGEGSLPPGVTQRAVEHERERSQALVLRERAAPIAQPPCNPAQGVSGLPCLPANAPVSLPALLKNRPALPDMLPPP